MLRRIVVATCSRKREGPMLSLHTASVRALSACREPCKSLWPLPADATVRTLVAASANSLHRALLPWFP